MLKIQNLIQNFFQRNGNEFYSGTVPCREKDEWMNGRMDE